MKLGETTFGPIVATFALALPRPPSRQQRELVALLPFCELGLRQRVATGNALFASRTLAFAYASDEVHGTARSREPVRTHAGSPTRAATDRRDADAARAHPGPPPLRPTIESAPARVEPPLLTPHPRDHARPSARTSSAEGTRRATSDDSSVSRDPLLRRERDSTAKDPTASGRNESSNVLSHALGATPAPPLPFLAHSLTEQSVTDIVERELNVRLAERLPAVRASESRTNLPKRDEPPRLTSATRTDPGQLLRSLEELAKKESSRSGRVRR